MFRCPYCENDTCDCPIDGPKPGPDDDDDCYDERINIES